MPMSRTPSEIKNDLEKQDLGMDPDDLLDSPDPELDETAEDEALPSEPSDLGGAQRPAKG